MILASQLRFTTQAALIMIGSLKCFWGREMAHRVNGNAAHTR
jgi:hypothetical protein